MRTELAKSNIDYVHFKDLGGRKDTDATQATKRGKQHAAFSGYAAYMKTETYIAAISLLEKLALEKTVAFMCAEGDWRKCHRSLMADDLLQKGWDVLHIIGVAQSEPHVLTPYAATPKLF